MCTCTLHSSPIFEKYIYVLRVNGPLPNVTAKDLNGHKMVPEHLF